MNGAAGYKVSLGLQENSPTNYFDQVDVKTETSLMSPHGKVKQKFVDFFKIVWNKQTNKQTNKQQRRLQRIIGEWHHMLPMVWRLNVLCGVFPLVNHVYVRQKSFKFSLLSCSNQQNSNISLFGNVWRQWWRLAIEQWRRSWFIASRQSKFLFLMFFEIFEISFYFVFNNNSRVMLEKPFLRTATSVNPGTHQTKT